MINLKTLSITALLLALSLNPAHAATDDDETDNVKVDSAKSADKTSGDEIYDFPNAPKVPIDPAKTESAPKLGGFNNDKKPDTSATNSSSATSANSQTPAAKADTKPDTTPKPEPKIIRMQPIISSGSAATSHPNSAKIKKPADTHPVAQSSDGPFRKSQDAGVKETIKKPEPKPEVKAKTLIPVSVFPVQKSDNITTEINKIDQMKPSESGLPIPRFVSLKSGEINARTGPGETYPIRWLYQRKNLPVEVTAEFKLWRRIKDFDGEQSWVHEAMLSSRRYAIISHDTNAYADKDGGGSAAARFKRGVQVKVDSCRKDYCQVDYGQVEGWVQKKDLWGVYDKETFN